MCWLIDPQTSTAFDLEACPQSLVGLGQPAMTPSPDWLYPAAVSSYKDDIFFREFYPSAAAPSHLSAGNVFNTLITISWCFPLWDAALRQARRSLLTAKQRMQEAETDIWAAPRVAAIGACPLTPGNNLPSSLCNNQPECGKLNQAGRGGREGRKQTLSVQSIL